MRVYGKLQREQLLRSGERSLAGPLREISLTKTPHLPHKRQENCSQVRFSSAQPQGCQRIRLLQQKQ